MISIFAPHKASFPDFSGESWQVLHGEPSGAQNAAIRTPAGPLFKPFSPVSGLSTVQIQKTATSALKTGQMQPFVTRHCAFTPSCRPFPRGLVHPMFIRCSFFHFSFFLLFLPLILVTHYPTVRSSSILYFSFLYFLFYRPYVPT